MSFSPASKPGFTMLRDLNKTAIRVGLFHLLILLCAGVLSAQSLDLATPAPIRNNNLLGRIAARDLGDARLTHHYYAFTGTPGDLLITVQSRNLNGDLDVFTANGLRPLLKLTLYAESTTPVTKGIYLRKREDLILRIEARSPNDDEGTYQLFFGGSFEPIVGGLDNGPTESATETSALTGDRKAKRVSSTGARLPEPDPPVTEVATTTSSPEASTVPSESPIPTTTVKPPPEEITKPTTARTPPRTRTPPTRRTTTPTATASKPKVVDEPKTEEAKTETGEVTEAPVKPKVTPRASTRRGTTPTVRTTKPAAPVEPAPEPAPEIGPRLVIETNDGTLINRSMSSVRRVTVENGQVVITGKDGKIDRILLANVLKMSIAP